MTETSSRSRLFSLRPDVVATVMDDGAVLLDLTTKYFYILNSTGWAITQLFEDGRSLAGVQAQCRDWGVEAEERAAAERLVGLLQHYDLLEPTDHGSEPPAAASIQWVTPSIERQPQPLQKVMVSAFDPSIPLAE